VAKSVISRDSLSGLPATPIRMSARHRLVGGALGAATGYPKMVLIFFQSYLDKWLIPSTFDYSTVHFMLVLTRPLADVSAPKHTAIWPAFIS